MTNKEQWVKWLKNYGPEALYDALITQIQGAVSTCIHCGQDIACDIVEGGGIPDWHVNGDYGCLYSPDTNDEGTGGHEPKKVQ